MASAFDTALNVARDPALPALLDRIRVLRDLETAQGTVSTVPSQTPTVGIGLDGIVSAIDSYIWFKRNKWVVGVGVGAMIFLPGLLGLALGRATKCR